MAQVRWCARSEKRTPAKAKNEREPSEHDVLDVSELPGDVAGREPEAKADDTA